MLSPRDAEPIENPVFFLLSLTRKLSSRRRAECKLGSGAPNQSQEVFAFIATCTYTTIPSCLGHQHQQHPATL